MRIQTFAPEGRLAEIIQSFHYYTEYNPGHDKERVIPDGSPYIVVALDGRPRRVFDNDSLEPAAEFRDVWLSGVQREYITIESLQESSMAAIRFVRGGARSLIGSLLDQSVGRIVPVSELGSIGAMDLCLRLRRAGSPEAAWAITCRWARSILDDTEVPPHSIRFAVREIERDPGFLNTRLADLVQSSGYSQKQFIHHFKRHVGLTPKVFQRVLRFHETLPRVVGREEVSWSDLSLQCGYYDQSHLIREFARFSGYNPAQFLSEVRERTNFLPINSR